MAKIDRLGWAAGLSLISYGVRVGVRVNHAGVVGWQGRAILIPGRSFSGKSTLVAALVRAGATYYSDEFAVLDERGRVHPFPKKLSMRLEGSARPRFAPVEELGGRRGTTPLRVG